MLPKAKATVAKAKGSRVAKPPAAAGGTKPKARRGTVEASAKRAAPEVASSGPLTPLVLLAIETPEVLQAEIPEALPTEADVVQLFQERDAPALSAVIHDLKHTHCEEAFARYRVAAEKRFKEADATIAALSAGDPADLRAENALLREKVARLEAQSNERGAGGYDTATVFQSPIKPTLHLLSRDDLELELEQIGVIFDMLEVITGLRIHNLDEDEEEITFDCSQVANDSLSDSYNWDYKLIVSKLGTNAANDILYIPETNREQLAALLGVKGLSRSDRRTVTRLLKTLPSYFLDTLTFPYDTLPQFYQNLAKALKTKATPLSDSE